MDIALKLRKFGNSTFTKVKVNVYTLEDNEEGSKCVDDIIKLVKKYAKKNGLEVQ